MTTLGDHKNTKSPRHWSIVMNWLSHGERVRKVFIAATTPGISQQLGTSQLPRPNRYTLTASTLRHASSHRVRSALCSHLSHQRCYHSGRYYFCPECLLRVHRDGYTTVTASLFALADRMVSALAERPGSTGAVLL